MAPAESTLVYRVPPPLTDTFTIPFVQQHWNPPPPSPDQSLATTRNTYSPGSLNVAVVVALPLKAGVVFHLPSAFSTAGLLLENFTVPSPRNLPHVTVTGGVSGSLPP